MDTEGASSLLISAYKDGKWSDVTIMNGDKKYRLHKHILSTAIPYFDKMFSSGLSESTSEVIKLDHPPIAFDLIIKWAYGSKILMAKENAADLFNLSDYMNITQLTSECLNFLWNNFDDSPFIDIDHWLDKIHTEEARKVLDRYIRSNFCDIVHSDPFLDYDVGTVTHMISLDDLNIDDEIQVFDAIITWIQKSVERRNHLSKLLKKVHWVEINGVQFINRIDKLSWIMKCDQARHDIMAAFELSYYKSLKTIGVNDVNFGPRYRSESFNYAVYRNNDSSIKVGGFTHKNIIFSENLHLPAAEFGDLHISEHCLDSDVVIRIDWRNKTYRLFKGSHSYILLFGRLFQFNRKDRKIHFRKGDRLIEFAHLTEDNTSSHETLTKHKGGLCLSTITTSLQTIAPTSCSNNHHYYKYYEYTQIYSQNKVEHKSYLIVTKSNLPGNRFDFVASHEFVTKEPIKMLKSTTFHDLLLIFVDCSLILSYDFQKNIFKEHNNNLNGRSLCFLHYHHFGPRLLIFNNDGHIRRQVLHVIDGGKLSCLPYSVDLYPNIVLDSNLIGFVSLEAKHQCDMHENELQIQIIQKIESSQIATSQ